MVGQKKKLIKTLFYVSTSLIAREKFLKKYQKTNRRQKSRQGNYHLFIKIIIAIPVLISILGWLFLLLINIAKNEKVSKFYFENIEGDKVNFRFKENDVIYIKKHNFIYDEYISEFQDDEYFWRIYRTDTRNVKHSFIAELQEKKEVDYYYETIKSKYKKQYRITNKNHQVVWQLTRITNKYGSCILNCRYNEPNYSLFQYNTKIKSDVFKVDNNFISNIRQYKRLTNQECQTKILPDKPNTPSHKQHRKLQLWDKVFYLDLDMNFNWTDYTDVWCNDRYTIFLKKWDGQYTRPINYHVFFNAGAILFDNKKKKPILLLNYCNTGNKDFCDMNDNNIFENSENQYLEFVWYEKMADGGWRIVENYNPNAENIIPAIAIITPQRNYLLVRSDFTDFSLTP